MAKRLDKIVVLELKFSFWEGVPPAGLSPEILAIGLCTVDVLSLEVGERDDLLVRPRAKISSYCQEITGLTNEELADGLPLVEALELLRHRHYTQDRMCAAWNTDIPRELELLSIERGFPYPLSDSFMNVMTIFASSHGFGRDVSLDAAMTELGLTYEGHPLAVDDLAYNAAQVLAEVLRGVRAKGRRRRNRRTQTFDS